VDGSGIPSAANVVLCILSSNITSFAVFHYFNLYAIFLGFGLQGGRWNPATPPLNMPRLAYKVESAKHYGKNVTGFTYDNNLMQSYLNFDKLHSVLFRQLINFTCIYIQIKF